jgi:hypothetical protein
MLTAQKCNHDHENNNIVHARAIARESLVFLRALVLSYVLFDHVERLELINLKFSY